MRRRLTVLGIGIAGGAALSLGVPPAFGAVRYAAPGGGGAQPCVQSAPCDLPTAATGTGTNGVANGDQVIVTPGTYKPGGLSITHAIDLGGELGQPLPTVQGSALNFFFVENASAYVHDLHIVSSGGLATFFLDSGTAERISAESDGTTGSYACSVFQQSVLRDSVCWGKGSGADGIGMTEAGGTETPELRNVTALASAPGKVGLFVETTTSGTTQMIDAHNVIARGTLYDIEAETDSSSGTKSTISLANSNYTTRHLVGTGASITPPGTNGNQTSSPLFVDAVAGDFHQASGSPTIDAGASDPANGATDLDGVPRIVGLGTDIGAYEAAEGPTVMAGPVSGVSATSATIAGSVNAGGSDAAYHVDYGATSTYGLSTVAQDAGSGASPVGVSVALAGLTPGTVYHYRLVATNALGTSMSADQTLTTLPAVPLAPAPVLALASPRDTTPPIVSSLAVSPSTFAIAKGRTATTATTSAERHHQGTKIEFKLTERAKVAIALARKTTGIEGGRSCIAPSRKHRHGKSCTRYVSAGSLTRRSEPAGALSISFTGRLGRRALAPGRYRLTLIATDPSGNASKAATTRFTIVGR